LKAAAGFTLIGVSFFMLLGFFNADLSSSVMATMGALLIGVGLPGTVGGVLVAQHFRQGKGLAKRREQLRLQTQEAEVLRLAGEHDGRLTVVEVVRELAMQHSGAEALLRSMTERGVADIEVTDSGLLVYTFPDVQRLQDKPTSRGVLDA
jgi:predicted DNA-binding transcriptional regulator